MTEKTCEVERLDRNSWPPECKREAHADRLIWTVGHVSGVSFVVGRSREATEEEARSAAWAQQEAQQDPPGMTVECVGLDGDGELWVWRVGSGEHHHIHLSTIGLARSAAWAWYWQRVAVAVRLSVGPFAPLTCECSKPPMSWNGKGASLCQHSGEYLRILSADFWPRCLGWPDEQVLAVKHWLIDSTAEMPEVLHG